MPRKARGVRKGVAGYFFDSRPKRWVSGYVGGGVGERVEQRVGQNGGRKHTRPTEAGRVFKCSEVRAILARVRDAPVSGAGGSKADEERQQVVGAHLSVAVEVAARRADGGG